MMDMYSNNTVKINNNILLHPYFKKLYLSELQHTMSQPLSAILNYINGCLYSLKNRDDLDLHPDLTDALHKAGLETEKMGKLLKNLDQFFCRDTPPLQEIDINELLVRLIHDLQPTLERLSITIRLCLTESLERVRIAEKDQKSLLWMIVSAVDLIASDKNQLALKLTTRKKQGWIIIKITCDTQEIFSFSIPLRGET